MKVALALALVTMVGCSSKPAADAAAPSKTSGNSPEATKADDKDAAEGEAASAEKPQAETMASAEIGKPAPDFTLKDLDGNEHRLSDHKGKIVVLEWWNPGCPFVKYAHTEGPLATMAAEETKNGVVWLTINSGAPGKQGAGLEGSREGVETFKMTNPVLLDESGEVGRAYGAEKTPHMYVIDVEGTLVYRGAIDNAPIGEVDGGGEAINYVAAALANVRAGRPVATPETPAYGCTVKYAS